MMKNSYLSIIAIITIVAFIGMLTIYYPKATVTGLAIGKADFSNGKASIKIPDHAKEVFLKIAL